MAITYFEPGTRVIFRRSPCWLSRSIKGEKGTVKVGSSNDSTVLVKPDTPVDNYKELWLFAEDMEAVKAKQPVIVITSDGKTTTATKRLGKKVICSATARCSDNDTFDFNTGAELAFQRLREKEKPVPKEKPWPKKLVCVEANAYPDELCVGQVYPTEQSGVEKDYGRLRVKNGTFWGIRRHSDTDFRINNFPDYARFIPLVED